MNDLWLNATGMVSDIRRNATVPAENAVAFAATSDRRSKAAIGL
jgi:hypothetical protein